MKESNVKIICSFLLIVSIFSCSSKRQDSVEYKNHIDGKIKDIENSLTMGNLQAAYQLVRIDINDDYALRNNYFVKFKTISEDDDNEYFDGEYIKKINEFKKLSEQIVFATENYLLFGRDIDKSLLKKNMNGKMDFDKRKITDERVRKALILSAQKRAADFYNEGLIESYKANVKSIIESFIKNNSTWGVVGIKDALVDRMNLKVISQDVVNNDYGSGFKYVMEGIYRYKGTDFNVKCELETAGMNSYYSTVEVK